MTYNKKTLNLHYCSVQIPYWMGDSVLMTFAAVFLLSRHFSNSQIGIVLAVANLLAAILQPSVAAFADKMKKMTLSQIAEIMSFVMIALSIVLVFIPNQTFVIAIIFILMYACLVLLQPITIAIGTFFISRGYELNFGLARGLGSLGFAIASVIAGFMIERFSVNVMLYLTALTFAMLFLGAFFIDTRKSGGKYKDLIEIKKEEQKTDVPMGLLEFAKTYKRFMVLLVGVAFIFFFHHLVNSYMYQIVEPLGGTESHVGTAVSVAAVSELPTMFFFSFILKKFKCKHLMRLAAIFFSIKGLIILSAGSIFMVNLAMSTQLLGFAMHTSASVYYVSQIIPKKDLVKGQALMTTANTIGGIFGNFIGGQMLSFTSVHGMLLLGTMVSIIGTIIICLSAEDGR